MRILFMGTPDIAAEGLRTVSCTEMGDLVCSLL